MSSASIAVHNHPEPVEYRACVVCGEIRERESLQQCGCGQFECEKHTCPCTPAEVWEAA